MIAEPQEYQYNADVFEARGVDEILRPFLVYENDRET